MAARPGVLSIRRRLNALKPRVPALPGIQVLSQPIRLAMATRVPQYPAPPPNLQPRLRTLGTDTRTTRTAPAITMIEDRPMSIKTGSGERQKGRPGTVDGRAEMNAIPVKRETPQARYVPRPYARARHSRLTLTGCLRANWYRLKLTPGSGLTPCLMNCWPGRHPPAWRSSPTPRRKPPSRRRTYLPSRW